MAAFPHGSYDDLHDAAVQGLMRFRQGGLIRIASDEAEDEITSGERRAPVAYY
jgi:hypothetical protein